MAQYEVRRQWRHVEVAVQGQRLVELQVDPSLSAKDLIYVPDEDSWGLLWPEAESQRDEILAAVRLALPASEYEYREYQAAQQEVDARRWLESHKPDSGT